MDNAAIELIRQAARGSAEGTMHFLQVVDLMVQAGVESYVADYRTRRTTYYLESDDAYGVDLEMPDVAIAGRFDAAALKEAIRGSQQGIVKYPEFKRLSRLAGCVGYTVWVAGRHVTYFGRRGETHVEHIPGGPGAAP